MSIAVTVDAGLHYELQAYVCGHACVQPSPFEGWATFAQIFNARPNDCRYAVVRRVTIQVDYDNVVKHTKPGGPFMVWDLYHDAVVSRAKRVAQLTLRPPPPTWTGDTADGMIMKAMALYERE